jgi:hypothetical protein
MTWFGTLARQQTIKRGCPELTSIELFGVSLPTKNFFIFMSRQDIEITQAALVLLAGQGKKQIIIPENIEAEAKQHILSGNTLGYSRRPNGELVIGWVHRSSDDKRKYLSDNKHL